MPFLLAAIFGLLALGARGGCQLGCDAPKRREYTHSVAYVAQRPDGGVPGVDPCDGATDCAGRCPSPDNPETDSVTSCSCQVTAGGTGTTLTCQYETPGEACGG